MLKLMLNLKKIKKIRYILHENNKFIFNFKKIIKNIPYISLIS